MLFSISIFTLVWFHLRKNQHRAGKVKASVCWTRSYHVSYDNMSKGKPVFGIILCVCVGGGTLWDNPTSSLFEGPQQRLLFNDILRHLIWYLTGIQSLFTIKLGHQNSLWALRVRDSCERLRRHLILGWWTSWFTHTSSSQVHEEKVVKHLNK